MPITNLNIINAYKALLSLESKSFDGEISYAIYEMLSKLKPKFDILEKTKNSLILKYSADKKSIKPSDENWPKFVEELEVIYNKEITLDFELYIFRKEDFNLKVNKDIQPSVWGALEFMMEKKADKAEADKAADKATDKTADKANKTNKPAK